MLTRDRSRDAFNRWQRALVLSIGIALGIGLGIGASAALANNSQGNDEGDNEDDNGQNTTPHIMWVNHFDLLPGGAEVTTTFNSTSSGVGGGLTGLVIHSSTTGEIFSDGGNKVVQMALEIPKNTFIKGVRVCYELSSAASFISQIRLAQVQNPPATALVLLDDGTDLVNPGPVCVNSAATSIVGEKGSVLLSLRVNFGNTADVIVVRALGVFVN